MHPIMKNWKKIDADVFWGEIAASDHVLQIYENDDSFLNALAGFVGVKKLLIGYLAIGFPFASIKAKKGSCAMKTAKKNASRKSSQQMNAETIWKRSSSIPVFRIFLSIMVVYWMSSFWFI